MSYAQLAKHYRISEDTLRRYWLTNPAIREALQAPVTRLVA